MPSHTSVQTQTACRRLLHCGSFSHVLLNDSPCLSFRRPAEIDALSTLVKLELLRLEGNQIALPNLRCLSSLPSLQNLSLQNAAASNPGIIGLQFLLYIIIPWLIPFRFYIDTFQYLISAAQFVPLATPTVSFPCFPNCVPLTRDGWMLLLSHTLPMLVAFPMRLNLRYVGCP